jgi:predicted small secreted protein
MKTIRIVLTLLSVITVLGLTGCKGTQRGIGEDMEHAGEKIQDSAN